jgi:DNA-binding NarL/FixJ family response regulator
MQKILIADDHPLFREAIRDVVSRLFTTQGWPFTCLEATQSREVFDIVEREEDLDLILLDLFMPGANGLTDLAALRHRLPATPIVVISSLEDTDVMRRTLTCGAAGFVPKSLSKELMTEALRTVLSGGIYNPVEQESVPPAACPSADAGEPLTPRQITVLTLLSKGRSNKQIANELKISEVTVKAHMTAILRKLGVMTRAQAIVAFQREQLARPLQPGM